MPASRAPGRQACNRTQVMSTSSRPMPSEGGGRRLRTAPTATLASPATASCHRGSNKTATRSSKCVIARAWPPSSRSASRLRQCASKSASVDVVGRDGLAVPPPSNGWEARLPGALTSVMSCASVFSVLVSIPVIKPHSRPPIGTAGRRCGRRTCHRCRRPRTSSRAARSRWSDGRRRRP